MNMTVGVPTWGKKNRNGNEKGNLVNGSHDKFNNSKRARTDGHGTEQGRPNTLPEPSCTVSTPRLGKARAHGRILLVFSEAVCLHLALDDIEGIAGQPKSLSGDTTIEGNLPAGNFLAVDAVTGRVAVHHVLKGSEPRTIGGGFTEDGHGRTAIQARNDALVSADFAHAVDGAIVQTSITVRLTL